MAEIIQRIEAKNKELFEKGNPHGTMVLSDINCVSASLNAVPSECSIYIDRRLILGETLDDMKKEIAEIKELLEAKDHCKVIPQKSFNTIWFRGDNGETELRLNFLGNLKLIVSRVCFHNRRQGTMTAVMQL